MSTALSKNAIITWRLTLVFYLLFLGLFIANFIQLYNPTQLYHWVICLAQIAPAAAFLPGILRKQRRPTLWFCFVLMLYFCFTVINLTRPVAYPWLSYAELIAQIGLFSSALYFGKYTQAA